MKNKVAKAEKAEKEEKEAQEKPLKKESHEDEPVVWYSDTSEEAARARREQMLPDSLLKPKSKR